MIKVTYNFHSCFTVELDESVFVFDYYTLEKKPECIDDQGKFILPEGKKVFFFVSHRHHDHFSKEIFNWKNDYEDVTFVLSDDIWMKNSNEPITFVGPGQTIQANGIEIKTLKSTDEGVAFLIKAEGKTIYHAGDLHWWYWEEKGEPYIKSWGEKYFKEIDQLKAETIDVAFVVLDPRMKNGESKGLEEFLIRVPNTKKVFPMHMWGDYDIITRFNNSEISDKYKEKVVSITGENQTFEV